MDVASMKLKQDVESSWECPFVSASEEKSEAQHAFCNVKTSISSRGLFCGCEQGRKRVQAV
ncbi:MAG: hypothetical protein DRP27_07710 [Thermotogae bacterium]|nr:MAG: hypothetical protein DRP27_07710 [Thermotogota bacterium]